MSLFFLRNIVLQLVQLYIWAIIIYAIMSWFPLNGVAMSIYRLLATICEPFISLVRRYLPSQFAGGQGIDLSPMAAIIILWVVEYIVGKVPL